MFSKSVQYGINLLANMPKVGEVESAKVLAKKGKVPEAYATKVLQALRLAGIVNSQRGVGGGVTLLRPLNKINVLEVIEAVAGTDEAAKGTIAEKLGAELTKTLTKMTIPQAPQKAAKPKKAAAK